MLILLFYKFNRLHEKQLSPLKNVKDLSDTFQKIKRYEETDITITVKYRLTNWMNQCHHIILECWKKEKIENEIFFLTWTFFLIPHANIIKSYFYLEIAICLISFRNFLFFIWVAFVCRKINLLHIYSCGICDFLKEKSLHYIEWCETYP